MDGHLSSDVDGPCASCSALRVLELSSSPPRRPRSPTDISYDSQFGAYLVAHQFKMATPVVQTIHRDPALLYVGTVRWERELRACMAGLRRLRCCALLSHAVVEHWDTEMLCSSHISASQSLASTLSVPLIASDPTSPTEPY